MDHIGLLRISGAATTNLTPMRRGEKKGAAHEFLDGAQESWSKKVELRLAPPFIADIGVSHLEAWVDDEGYAQGPDEWVARVGFHA